MERKEELEESKKRIIVPTLKEKIELGLTDKEWTMICYKANENGKCAREIGGHKLCNLCPKFTKIKISEELAKEIEILLAKTMKRLVYRRPYHKRR